MEWRLYWAMLRRRWWVVLAVLLLGSALSGYQLLKSRHSAGYQACETLYVADTSAPSIVSAPDTTMQGLGQLLAGESAANFFADDLLDVAQGSRVAGYVAARLADKGLADSAFASINGAVSGSRKDRTVQLCVSNPSQATALAAARTLGYAMTVARAQFVGRAMFKRTFVSTVSAPSVGPAPTSHALFSFLLRVILSLLLGLGFALLWDAIDPRVRDGADVERSLGVPLLAEL